MSPPASLTTSGNSLNISKILKSRECLLRTTAPGHRFMPDIKKYATQNAVDYSVSGGGRALIDSFTNAFGEVFDSSVHEITDIIGEGRINIGGIDFIIKQTGEAFDIEIPEINAVYTHMLGHAVTQLSPGLTMPTA